ncbi:DinB family protein [Niabella yanshanensis]|uniref:DinB family protein n=1 Tax=Niabella yanshanensis TaxID=577386 RepID=A0ABZ0WAG6_9BACT|nr:DinB family protein [Niabella yanshanensis]WQD39494.1 DinB family protein [Niabella yanshanensis]
MERNVFLANRLREVYLDGRWIANTNYKDQLLSVNLELAIKQIGDLNTIAALTFHINYYLEGILNVFNGGKLEISDQYSFDLPPIETEADWESLVGSLLGNAEKFTDAVAQMDDQLFDEVFVEEKYDTYLRNIQGVLEHSYYHLGQIVLIRKLVSVSSVS